MEVVDAIAKTRTGMQDRPVEEQKIASITVEVNGAALAELKKLPDPYGRF
jgi:predicted deacylase